MSGETEELRRRIMELLEYSPETGLFRWCATGKGRKPGWFYPSLSKRNKRRIKIWLTIYDARRLAWLIHTGEWPQREVYERDNDVGLVFSNLFQLTEKSEGTESTASLRKRLMEVIRYDPDTGFFHWTVVRKKATVGAVAGRICKTVRLHKCIVIGIFGEEFLAHRLAWLFMTGSWPKHGIDHENHNATDNVWTNLRDVTQRENSHNMSIQKRNRYGVTGVYYSKKWDRWWAEIRNGKKYHLGWHDTFEAAVSARKSAEVEHGFHPNHCKERTR